MKITKHDIRTFAIITLTILVAGSFVHDNSTMPFLTPGILVFGFWAVCECILQGNDKS